MVVVSAKVEAELSDMPPEEASEWLDMLGVTSGDGGLSSLIRASYKTLGLQTYFTTGGLWEQMLAGRWPNGRVDAGVGAWGRG